METVTRLNLDELKTVRVECKNKYCGLVAEFDLGSIKNAREIGTNELANFALCRLCKHDPMGSIPKDPLIAPLHKLAVLMAELKNSKTVRIEFLIANPRESKS